MNLVLMLDSMSSRYHCLPSHALANASTFDLFVLTRALEYYNRKRNPDKYKTNGGGDMTQNQLQSILNTVKKGK